MLRRFIWLILPVALAAALLSRPSVAEDPPGKDKPKAAEAEEARDATVKVEKGPLASTVNVKCTIQSEEAVEMSVRLKNWSGTLVVHKAVEHGASVKAGDVLVEFELEKIDRAIKDAKRERDLAQIAILQAERELPILERQAPLDLATAERDSKQANEDLKRFLEVDKKLAIQTAEFQLKSALFYAEYSKDELKQLQKMYRDKDLTEETEKMILKRYLHTVESAELYAVAAKIETDNTLKIEIPRREQTVKVAAERAELALARARDVAPLTIEQKKLALAQLRYEDSKAKEHLAELEQDRAAFTVKAPADGLAYYGRFVRGQWMVPAGTQGPALLGAGPINPGDVFLTVVSATKLVAKAEVEEKELPGLKLSLGGKLVPTAFPDKKVACEIARIAPAPLDGKFDVLVKLTDAKVDGLVPGMSGSIKFVTNRKKDALTVPSTAVFEEPADDTHYVYRVLKKGKHEKRTVKIGIVSGDRTEIVEGLKAGEEILAAKP